MTQDVAAIARGLTKAQRKAVKGAVFDDSRQEWQCRSAMFPADRNLRMKGLAKGLWVALTPLGLSVRQHLLSQDTGEA